MSSTPLPSTARKNVQTIAEVEGQMRRRRTRVDILGEAIARFFGTPKFIVAHGLFFAVWFTLNLGFVPHVVPFDPYPYPFLCLIVGIEFIFLTTFVLMNQNRQSLQDEQRDHLNLQLAILAEQENTKNMQMLQTICTHLGLDTPNEGHDSADLAQDTQVPTLIEEIGKKLGGSRR